MKQPNSVSLENGAIMIKLYKKEPKKWSNFIDPALLSFNNASFDVKSSQSDISDGFFDEIDDEELRKEMDKLIYQAMQS